MNNRGKNAVIEFMRFLFASAVVVFHSQLDLWKKGKVLGTLAGHKLILFRNGYIGVEFFFIVSGFLMARSVYRLINKETQYTLGEETGIFIWKKMKALFPYYFPACTAMAIIVLYKNGSIIKVLSMRYTS